MDSSEEQLFVHGIVRWFDVNKGYGFIAADGYGDILLHVNVLRNFGQSAVSDGTSMVAEIKENPRGFQVINIVSIEAPAKSDARSTTHPEAHDVSRFVHLEVLPARVKWYDTQKGYGFVNVFGNPADVFLHTEVVRVSGLGKVMQGEAVGVRVNETERGLMVVHVLNWGSTYPEGPR